MAENPIDSDTTMMYDLRAYHANLCGTILIRLQEAMHNDDLPTLFKLLTENLYTEVQQKFSDDERKEYWEMLNGHKDDKGNEVIGIIKLINNTPDAFNNPNSKAENRTKIKFNIYNLMWYMRKTMEVNGMFGRKEDEGL